MKKVMILLLVLFAFTANAQNTKATLDITQVADMEFTTDLFELIFYGEVKLSTSEDSYAKMVGEGYDVKFQFYNNGMYDNAHLIRYSYVGADCIATLQSPLFKEKIVINCFITEVVNNEGFIVITVRGTKKKGNKNK